MSKSTQPKAAEILGRYLQAVRFWLPKSQQSDITAELSEDLRAQIEDRETELGHPLDEAETMVILKRCGSPIVVASRYRPQTQLIGPILFPIYEFVMKLVILWTLIPVFIVIVGPAMILSTPNHWGAFMQTIGALWTALFISAGAITIVFAILERTEAKLQLVDKWDLRSLPQVPKESRPPSRTQTIFELVMGIVGIVWLLAVPHYPFLIFGPAAAFVKLAPTWRVFYLPMLLLAVAGVAHQITSLMRPQWTWFPAAARLLTTVLTLVLVNFMINAAARAGGGWHPFVVLADSVQPSLQHDRVEAIINVSILLCLVGTWIGLCIAGIVQTWELLRQFRRGTPLASGSALRCMF
jgi:hypothetical protein